MKDGKPFRYVSGSFHYYRTMPETWRQRFRTMRAAGLNAISTYVEWSMHNPKPGNYVWNGMADIDLFIRLAAEEGLLVILRVGPFICSERDMVSWITGEKKYTDGNRVNVFCFQGGLPYWLLTKYPNIKLRTYDPGNWIQINFLAKLKRSKLVRFHLFTDYIKEIRIWYNQLFPRITKHLV